MVFDSARRIYVLFGGYIDDGSDSEFADTWELRLPACYANCDGSVANPVLNVSDYICFLGKFAAADAYANCDGSTVPPVLNINDFLCFQSRFAFGCP